MMELVREIGEFFGDVAVGYAKRVQTERSRVRIEDAALFITGISLLVFEQGRGPGRSLIGGGLSGAEGFTGLQLSRFAGAVKDVVKARVRGPREGAEPFFPMTNEREVRKPSPLETKIPQTSVEGRSIPVNLGSLDESELSRRQRLLLEAYRRGMISKRRLDGLW